MIGIIRVAWPNPQSRIPISMVLEGVKYEAAFCVYLVMGIFNKTIEK